MNKQQDSLLESKNSHQFYRVSGQDALRLRIRKGDYVDISSFDGQQGCELLALTEGGIMEGFGGLSPTRAQNTLAQLAIKSVSAKALWQKLAEWEVTTAHLDKAFCFEADNLPRLSFDQDVTLIVLCTGEDMTVDAQQPVTELQVCHSVLCGAWSDLPAPLTVVDREFRIPHSSATRYQVKAGEWIQVMDVEGKQCSDFIAFDQEALEQGKEIMLDEVGTRSAMSRSMPTPGLYSKFCDPYQQTMLELVQDTVGHHDSFLYACNAKVYEDSGYFDHANCTDNINQALQGTGVAPRFGWPAINFFFNTEASDCGDIGFAEPFSRAGDYVLLRATRDLLCVSTSCSDDVDAANGWRPTDIHIRIYSAECDFPRSIGYRLTPEELPRMTKQTGFHPRTALLTKKFIEYRGYWVASEYQNWGAKAEYLACRERVAMIDLSPLRKLEIIGPDAEDFLQLALTRNVRRVAVGEIVYSAMCHETGGMIDDGTLFRLGEQAFRWICGDSYSAIWLRELAQKTGLNVTVRESTDQIHNLAVQGPRSRELLEKLIWTSEHQPDFVDLKWFHFLVGRLGGPTGLPLMVSRTGYTGELGFEVWCHPDHAPSIWDAIWQAGAAFDIAPLGFDALDMLRIEAGLIFADHEFCPETNPFEAGIGFTTPLKTQEEDFIGRSAIEQQTPASRKRLIGLCIEGNDRVHHGDSVFNGRFPVGVVTSAMISPLLKGQIAMCRLAPNFAEVGTKLEIGQLDGHKKRIKATVTSLPFYDPERTKVRS
ncbi:DUF1989 domain-containing protein [Marinomonas algarum]|uniref:Aminomethyltransferase family protein n=1 Tax=Marinomonas algarum TaxID=2883105 RepID=A0A9X1LD67_9GAMM|nr:aminomethyltransferase family protein [Marinomonas algarum]MCB5162824.1 aminomethyltransferase family protein [Marinomonas algarum]